MKITNVEVFPLRGAAQGRYGPPYAVIIRLSTDDGLVGYGETDSCPEIIKAIVEAPYYHEHMGGLRHFVLGQDPLDPPALRSRMERGVLCAGHGGAVCHAMSAIEMASWDILGRVTSRPLHSFLGTQQRSRIRTYATHPLAPSVEQSCAQAMRLVDSGFSAVKFGWKPFGENADNDERIVRALRAAIGPNIDLLIDCGNAFDADQALDRMDRLADQGIYWFEEPLMTTDLDGYARLAESEAIPIAAGEQCSTIGELRQLVERGRVRIVQVDISRVGITRAAQFAQLMEPLGVKCVNHTYTLDLALAASLHLAAVLDDPLLLEYPASPNDLRDRLFWSRCQLADGFAAVPDGPGLGVELDETQLANALAAV